MEPGHLLPFAAWESFYVIVGSSAAALTGLQFVVIVLGAEVNVGASNAVTRAFGTPTIVHFSAVLLLAATLSAPWPGVASAGTALAIFGALGVLYGLSIIRHARSQTDYEVVLEDWIWHFTLPIIGYAMLFGAAITLQRHVPESLFVIAGTSLLLLFVGIHNAWDSVTYIAIDGRRRREERERERERAEPAAEKPRHPAKPRR
ncbi:MAG TPA: hypothetical protein VGP73_25100 [Thermoanaerobaculia bacterium]